MITLVLFLCSNNFVDGASRPLQFLTSDYDEQYYEYYGEAPDNYAGKELTSKKSQFFCWSCNAKNMEKCIESGTLEQVRFSHDFNHSRKIMGWQ
jgi:hypothetical protein